MTKTEEFLIALLDSLNEIELEFHCALNTGRTYGGYVDGLLDELIDMAQRSKKEWREIKEC